jgi:hypothetical protein
MGETQRSSLPFPLPNRIPRNSPSLYKREKMGETQSFHPSTIEKYGTNKMTITLPPPAQRETKGEAPSLCQREKMGETQRSSHSLPLHKEKPRGKLPPSTKEKRWEKHKCHQSPPSIKENPSKKHKGHHSTIKKP